MDLKELSDVQIKQSIANFIIPLVAILMSLSLLGLYIYPSLSGIPNLEQELENKKRLESQLADKVKKLSSLLDYRQNVDESNALVSQALSQEPEVPQLLTQIDQIARESGLVIARMNYAVNDTGTDKGEVGYQVVAVNLGTTGTYNQVVTFLKNIENSSRVINVNNIRFVTDDDTGEVAATFVLVSPYVKVQTAANIDEPIVFDITAPEFQQMMDTLRSLRYYNITVDSVIDINALPNEELLPEESVFEEVINPAPVEEITPEVTAPQTTPPTTTPTTPEVSTETTPAPLE